MRTRVPVCYRQGQRCIFHNEPLKNHFLSYYIESGLNPYLFPVLIQEEKIAEIAVSAQAS